MLYHVGSETLIHVVVAELTEAEIRRFAAQKGGVHEGNPVRQVALVFIQGRAHAERYLPALVALGLECRAIVDGAEQVLALGDRASAVGAVHVRH
jgi:hypothetical protein